MNKITYHPKLELNKEVVIKYKRSNYKREPIHEKDRRFVTCCDMATYASTPYKY